MIDVAFKVLITEVDRKSRNWRRDPQAKQEKEKKDLA